MATIITRAGKGTPLTNTEVDDNFTNLNTDKAELSGSAFTGNISTTGILGVGTASPDYTLDIEAETAQARVHSTVGNSVLRLESVDTGESKIYFADNSASSIGTIEYHHNTNHMSFSTVATTRMLINSSGNVGIGTTSPSEALHVSDSSDFLVDVSGSDSAVVFKESGGNSWRIGNDSSTDAFVVSQSESSLGTDVKLFINSSGNVGIGTSSPASILSISGTDTTAYSSSSVGGQNSLATLKIQNLTTSADSFASIDFNTNNNRVVNRIVSSHGSSTTGGFLAFVTEGSGTPAERMRIDSSGNLLVGTTDTTPFDSSTESGVVIGANGQAQLACTSIPLYINRQATEGGLINFRIDGSPVGSIGAYDSRPYLASTTLGIRVSNALFPCNTSGVITDGACDIGGTSGRFQDIYRSGSTYSTSDRNKKQDIRDLTDAEARVATVAKGSLKAFRYIDSVEAEGDEANIHFGIIAQDLKAAFEAEGLNANDYQVFKTSTYTDDDGVEQTTYSVCYENLLAFIIAAI